MKIRILEKQLRRDGYTFTQVFREGQVAIYRQERNGVEAWEVIRIRTAKPHPRDLVQDQLVERYPSAEQWGTLGWTFMRYEDALGKALAIVRQTLN